MFAYEKEIREATADSPAVFEKCLFLCEDFARIAETQADPTDVPENEHLRCVWETYLREPDVAPLEDALDDKLAMDVALTPEETEALHAYQQAREADGRKRLGNYEGAGAVILYARRLYLLLMLRAPAIVIANEVRDFAAAFAAFEESERIGGK